MTTDPVCGMRVDERESEFRTQFAGKKYFFCSEECRKEFEDRPRGVPGDSGIEAVWVITKQKPWLVWGRAPRPSNCRAQLGWV